MKQSCVSISSLTIRHSVCDAVTDGIDTPRVVLMRCESRDTKPSCLESLDSDVFEAVLPIRYLCSKEVQVVRTAFPYLVCKRLAKKIFLEDRNRPEIMEAG